MTVKDLKQKHLFELTGEEFIFLQQNSTEPPHTEKPIENILEQYVYGIKGIASIFHCSIPTANRIKRSGVIDSAITQIGRKIICDREVAIELLKKKRGGRK